MLKDGGDAIKLGNRPSSIGKISLFDGHRQSGRLLRFARARYANGRKINSADAKTLPGEPEAIATVTIAGNKYLAAGSQAGHLRAQISLWLLAVNRLRQRKAFVPHFLRIRPLVVSHIPSSRHITFQNARE